MKYGKAIIKRQTSEHGEISIAGTKYSGHWDIERMTIELPQSLPLDLLCILDPLMDLEEYAESLQGEFEREYLADQKDRLIHG